MKRLAILVALLALAPLGAGPTAAPAENEITVTAALSADKLSPGTPFRVAVTVDLPDPWHIQANPAALPELIPTVLTLESNNLVQFGAVTYPTGKPETVSWADRPVALYAGKVVIVADGKVGKNAPLGPVILRGSLRYQACDNQVCYAPKTVPVILETEIAAQSQSAHPEVFATTPAPAQNSIDELIQRRGLFLALVAVFLGGLALNLTPCVYPMITITVSYFGSRQQRFSGALLYCLGIVASYSVLGIIAALTGGLFGALLQSKWVLLGVAGLMVVLALSLFGLFEIQPPQFLVQRAAGMSSKAGQIGLFFLGATMGIVAAPCLAPFAVALLAYVGTSRQWWWFLVFSCGLALPYLVLGTFSGLLSTLPKSGTWMVWVKRVFGVALLAVAVWFAMPVLGLKAGTSPIAWQPYAPVEKPGQPVIIDFYADWCIPCHEMDKQTFADLRVVEKSKSFRMLRADLTSSDSPYWRDFKIVGVPTFVFLDANGHERTELRQVGFVSADKFLAVMDRALVAVGTNSSR
jgi:thiol:disulfide interchange protein DsbD